jgi:hypothetical protein
MTKTIRRIFSSTHIAFAITGLAVTTAITGPALAQPIGGIVIVMHYKAPDGSIKTIPAPTPGDAMTLEQCQEVAPRQVPVLTRQLGNKRNFPEFAGWQFQHATCQPYSEDLLTTID